MTAAVPQDVGIPVFTRCSGVQRVHLHSAGIYKEVIRGLAGAGRIEADTNPVVIECIVSPADGGPDLVRLRIEATEREIKIAIVVRNADLSPLVQFLAVKGVV